MNDTKTSSSCSSKIIFFAVVCGIIALPAIILDYYSSMKNDNASATQIANQYVQNTLIVRQNQLLSEQSTAQAQRSIFESQTTISVDNSDSSITATAFIAQIEATRQAIADKQFEIEKTAIAVALISKIQIPSENDQNLVLNRPPICTREGAFKKDSILTQNPYFFRPDGYTSGWISSDSATIILPDGTEEEVDKQFVLFVENLSEVRIEGVELRKNGEAYTEGCWYVNTNVAKEDAKGELCLKKSQGNFAKYYMADSSGLNLLGTTETIFCP